MKHFSPFVAFAIEALCEYPGMKFDTKGRGWFKRFADLPGWEAWLGHGH
jgi:hypothetical protein